MTLLKRLPDATERLDEPGRDPAVLEDSLEQIAGVNRWLGGRKALLRHVRRLLPARGGARLLDIGTGSGDLPRALVDWGRRRGLELEVVATDLNPDMLDIARRKCAAYPEIRLRQADARQLPWSDGEFDVATASMTLHHLSDEDAVRTLRELRRVTTTGLVVNELERSLPGYLGARILSWTVWRDNELTRHDGPLSIRKGYTTDELELLARRASLGRIQSHRHWAFRVVLTARYD